MKSLTEIAGNFKRQPMQSSHELQNSINPIVKELVDQVFKQLEIIFPGWKYALPDENRINLAKREWVKAFYENKIDSLELIKCGLIKSRKSDSDFLPSCGKFISWCKPSAEDLGYPSEYEAMQRCIQYRANQKMFRPLYLSTRPLIIELCERVDWWLVNNASNQQETKKAEIHFRSKYLELIGSGYVEPQQNNFEQLPTENDVNENLSDEQREDKRLRGLDAIRAIKAKFKGNK